MATRKQTVKYAFPALASLAHNTLTTLTQISIDLGPGTKTFRSVKATITCDDIINATGGTITTKTFNCRVGAAAYTSVANANAVTNSGENISLRWTADFTSHFTTNWSGSEMTCDFQVQIAQSSGTGTGMANVCVTLDITYEFDDTQTTQVKTVMMPLDMSVGALQTATTTLDTIPALDSELPEAGKAYKNIHIVVQGNSHGAVATTDNTLTLNVGSATVTTGSYEGALQTDRWVRYVWNLTSAWPNTGATQAWQPVSAQSSRFNHSQAWLVVTYSFTPTVATTLTEDLDASETAIDVANAALLGAAPFVVSVDDEQMYVTSVASNTLTVTRGFNGTTAATHTTGASVNPRAMNSVMLPMELASPMGGTTSSDYQRGTRELFVQEPKVTPGRVAFYSFWNQIAAIAGLNMRIGTGSFVTYADNAGTTAGNNGAMTRNDAAFTIERGRNTLNFDIYRTDAADFGWNLSGFWIVTYTSDVAPAGIRSHNHTVEQNIRVYGTAAAGSNATTAALDIPIPETDYYIAAIGTNLTVMTSGTVAPSAWTVLVERLDAEGGVQWEPAYIDSAQTDPEVGAFQMFSQMRTMFKRWPTDPGADRMDIETARRWRIHMNGSTAATGWFDLDVVMTYHSITYEVAGTVGNYADADGAGLTVWIHRAASGERIGIVTTTAGGAFTFTWYEDIEDLLAICIEDATHCGASFLGVAT